MANIKFSQFSESTNVTNVDFIVGYDGATNVRISPTNLVNTSGGPFLPLAGGTMAGVTTFNDHTQHGDQVKAKWGTGNDLEIYHDGSNSYIVDVGTGDLRIDTSAFRLRSANGGETMVTAFEDGAVNLMHNNITRLSTTSTGVSVTGGGTFTGDVSAEDNLYLTDATTVRAKIQLNSSDRDDLDIKAVSLGSNMKFFTVDAEKMRITSTGSVGIGETSPDARLHVTALASNGISNVKLESPGASKWAFGIPASQTYFALDDTSDNLTTPKLVVLKTSGNVGIGTDSPGAKLEVNSGGGIHLSDDTAGRTLIIKPSLTGAIHEFTSDNTSAGYSFSNNASEFMRITSAGNVGIGETSPGAKLEVKQATSGNNVIATLNNTDFTANNRSALKIRQQAAVGGSFSAFLGATQSGNIFLSNDSITANHLVISNAGNVGIGNITPLQKLHVTGASDGNSIYTAVLQNLGTAAGTASKLFFMQGGSTIRGAAIGGLQEATSGSPTSMVFETSAAFATPTERMRITSSGNVGIGSTSPTEKLSVTGGGTFTEDVTIGSAGAASDKTLNILTGGTKSAVKLMEAGTVYGFSTLYDGATNKFHINRHSNSATGTPVLSLNRDDDNAVFAGDVEISTIAKGLILKSPDGTRYRVTVANGGTLSVAAV